MTQAKLTRRAFAMRAMISSDPPCFKIDDLAPAE